jgi:hypothetical protein
MFSHDFKAEPPQLKKLRLELKRLEEIHYQLYQLEYSGSAMVLGVLGIMLIIDSEIPLTGIGFGVAALVLDRIQEYATRSHAEETLLQIVDELKLNLSITDGRRSSITIVKQTVWDKLQECKKTVEKEEQQFEKFLGKSYGQFKNKGDAKEESASVTVAIASKL